MAKEKKPAAIVPVATGNQSSPAPVKQAKSVGVPRVGLSAAILRMNRIKEPQGLGKLVEEMRADYQFNLAEWTLRALAKSIPITIEVQGDARAQALADNLTQRWEESIEPALQAIAYGRQAFERWYCWEPSTKLLEVAPLTAIPFECSTMELDECGSIGVKISGREPIELEPDRVWWFGLDATEIMPHGRSRFLGAPLKVWKLRRQLDNQDKVFLSRFALGKGVAKGPDEPIPKPMSGQGTVGEVDNSSQLVDPLEVLKESLQMVESGGYLVLPSGNNSDGSPAYEITSHPEPKDGAPLENKRKSLDDAALASMGIPPRAVTQDSSVGSLAMATAHLSVLKDNVNGILEQVVASFQRHIVDEAVDVNWPAGQKPTLTVVAREVDDKLVALVVEAVKNMLTTPQVSPIIANGVVDVERLLEIAGVPMGQDVQKKMERIRISSIPLPSISLPATPSPTMPAAPNADPTAAAVAGGDATVQDTALNGAQIASLLEVVGQIVAKQLPAEGGREILKQAFPLMDPEAIDKIVQSVAKFQPTQIPAAQGVAMATALAAAKIHFASRQPPADAVSPEDLLARSRQEMKALWPRLAQALANREALPRRSL